MITLLGHVLRRWLLAKFISMAVVGVLTGIGLWLLEVPLAISLAVLASLLTFIPNIGPVIARKQGRNFFAMGGSGGRKIFPAVLQLTSMLIDYAMPLEQAWHTPRIDASGGERVGVDPRLGGEIRAALEREFKLIETELIVYPTNFACPSAVMRDHASGENVGIADVMSPWSGAVSEDMV